MSQQIINVGSSPNDNTGDPIRLSFQKTNSNFSEIYSNFAGSNFRFNVNSITTTQGGIIIAPFNGNAITLGSQNCLLVTNAATTSSSTTGALVVSGGVGIGGALNVANDVTIGGMLSAPAVAFDYLDATAIGTYTPSIGIFSNVTADHMISNNNITAHSISAGSGNFTTLYPTTLNFDASYGNSMTVGTAFIPIATITNLTSSNVKITGGSISGISLTLGSLDNTPIGKNTPNTGNFTTMTSSNAQITGGNITGVALSIVSLNNTPIGNATPSTGQFTALGATGTIYANSTTASTNQSTGALQVSGGIGVAGNVWANQVYATNNGNGTNFRIGDDAWLGDINVANTTRLMGVEDNTQGYVVFGNGDTASLGRSGTGALTYTGDFTAATIRAQSIDAGTLGNSSANIVGLINTNIQPFITGLGTLTSLNVSGTTTAFLINATTINANVNGNVSGYFTGPIGKTSPNTATFSDVTINGNLIASNFNIQGNITGSASSASSATTAGTATYASTAGFSTVAGTLSQSYQGNITGVGILSNLQVSGAVTFTQTLSLGNVSASGNVFANSMTATYGASVGNIEVISGNIALRSSHTISSSIGSSTDGIGKIVWDNSYLYICVAAYDGVNPIWKRVALTSF